MTKEQAMQKAREAVYNATELFEMLDKEGRLKVPGRQVREELADHVAEFVADNWVSFDQSPNETELADAVDQDEAKTGDGASGDASTGTTGEDPTVPSMDSAVIAADERKRLEDSGEGADTDTSS